MRIHIIFILILAVIGFSAFAAASVRQTEFAEVQITLDENFTLSDAQALPEAPGSGIQVLDDGREVKVQIPANELTLLEQARVSYEILRRFLLVTASPDRQGPAPD